MPDYHKYWKRLSETAAEVSKWPEWKRGGVSVISIDHSKKKDKVQRKPRKRKVVL